jgi:hypothetical protein
MINPIPWYKSSGTIVQVTTAVSALIAIFPKAGQLLGLTSATDITNAVTNVFGVITLVAPVVGIIIRKFSKVQPITLTQASADAQTTPATQAAQNIHDANVLALKAGAPPIIPVPSSVPPVPPPVVTPSSVPRPPRPPLGD